MSTVLVSDSFTRADTVSGLGTAETGQTWQSLIATMQVAGGRSRSASGVRSASVVNVVAGSGNVIVDADCGSGNMQGGYALYFRASDADNWWRLTVDAESNTYNTGGSHQVFAGTYHNELVCTGTWTIGAWFSMAGYQATVGSPTYAPGGHYYYDNGTVNGCPGSGLLIEQMITTATHYVTQHSGRGITPNSYLNQVPDYYTVNDTATAYTWNLLLEKCVAGVVSQVSSVTLPSAPTHIKVVADGDVITGSCDTGQQVTATNAFNHFATLHGLGFSETSMHSNTDGLDNFTVSIMVVPYIGWGIPM